MTTETQPTKSAGLYRKLAAISGAIGAVEKDGRNQDQKYRYPTPASVFLGVKPLLDQQQLAIVPHLVEFVEVDTGQKSGGGKPFILNRVTMHYHIVDGESGEEMVVPWMAQAGTYGDDKGLAKAQTIALRTFLIQLFQIPAEDPETDPDARDSRPPHETRQPAQQRPAAQRPGAGYTPPAERPAQAPNGNGGTKRQLTQEELAEAVRTLWAEEKRLGGVIPTAEIAIDLDEASREQLIDLGKKARVRVLALEQRGMPEVDLPASLPTTTTA